MNGNELMHYGVLGMRWGHRKSPESYGGSITKTGKYRASNKQKKVNKGLNRIGTMKLVKVAENVYERRMV